MSIEPTQILIERVRAAARFAVALGEPTSLDQMGSRACELGRTVLGADAAALFFCKHDEDERPALVAASGFALLPPEGLPATLDAGEVARLCAWSAAAGFARAEIAPVMLDGQLKGLLALFSVLEGPELAALDLETLGAAVALALRHLRSNSELARAYEKQDREQDRLVRAERMRALGEMALGIAHDFNNVLNAMLGQVGVLHRLTSDREDIAAVLDKMRRCALDAAATVGRVQEFTRQRRDQEFSPLALAEVVEATARAALSRARAGIELGISLGAAGTVHGNAAELGEVLKALIDNAAEAMPAGGRIALSLEERGDEVILTVSDGGRGMSRDVRRRAFDPFFTTKGSRVKGLGLSLAYGIVRRHGGRIEVESTMGRGTRIQVRLPRAQPAAGATPELLPEVTHDPMSAASCRRVLLVEDDPDNREAMCSLLELSGFEVTSTECGAAGVRAFGEGAFDLVLTDLGLPDMNGWQVAGAVKASTPATPIALITGWGFNLDADEIRRRGVDLLVKKPIDPRSFLQQLEGLLSASLH